MKAQGLILHPAQLTFYTTNVLLLVCNWRGAFFSLHRHALLNQGMLFPLQWAVKRKEEAYCAATIPWCYFAVSENNYATNQEIPGLKSVARCSDAILRAQA